MAYFLPKAPQQLYLERSFAIKSLIPRPEIFDPLEMRFIIRMIFEGVSSEISLENGMTIE